MSGLIVGLVLRTPISEAFNTEAKFVATVYADHAWEDGTHAYPAVDTVAAMVGLHPRTVQRYMRALEKLGMLIPDGKGPRGTNRYKFPLEIKTDGSVRLALVGGGAVPPHEEAEKEADSGGPQPPLAACQGGAESGGGDSGGAGATRINNPSLTVVVVNAGEVFSTYETEIGALTPAIADAISGWLEKDKVPASWIVEACKLAAMRNSRNWKYVEGILKNWKSKGKDSPKPSSGGSNARTTPNGNGGRGSETPTQAKPTEADRDAAARVRARKAQRAAVS